MTEIENTLDTIKASCDSLQHSTDEISQLTRSIDEFSHQANLLALNAMIEVAKVGKSGKALSELAEEISSLATRSAGVAVNISEIVASVRKSNLTPDAKKE